jgi:hypothetical protein
VALIDLQQQAVLGLEVIGDTARIGAGGLRDVAYRDGVESVGREQLFGGREDRFAHVGLAHLFPIPARS